MVGWAVCQLGQVGGGRAHPGKGVGGFSRAWFVEV